MFQASCQAYPQHIAFSCMGVELTYQKLWELSTDFAAFLQHELKLVKGDRIGIMLPNILQYPVALFGSFLAGLTVINLNPLDKALSLKHELNDAGAKAVLVLENFGSELEQILHETSVQRVVITSFGSLFPKWKRILINFYLRKIKKAVPTWHIPGHTGFRAALKLGKARPYQPVALTGQDLAFLQFTGGTTGIAKGVMLSHGNMVANMHQAATWVSPVTETGRERIITALPLYHIFSLLANCLVFMSIGGENVLIPDPRNLPSLIKELRRKPFSGITGVNTLFNALLHRAEFAKLNFSRLKITLGGGMAIQKAVADQWQKVTGCVICQAYGLTETSPAVTINPPTVKEFNGSIGLPISSTLVSIRDKDGKELPLGEVGELCVQGPQVMQGYWHREAETQMALRDGWLHTADGAYMDKDGYVYIVDRLKDMVIVSGFNVYPAEVEQLIKSIPGVNEVAVIGIPDALHGEVVKAFIVLEKGADLTAQRIKDFCHSKLAAYKTPREIEFTQSLPKSPVGKILKKDLREQELAKKRA
jgi:long-chain acyl-CoA synthetase